MLNKFWKRTRSLLIILAAGVIGIAGVLSIGNKAEEKVYAEESKDKIEVRPGIEVLIEDHLDWLEDKRVGLITNPTGVTSDLKSSIDVLHEHPDVNLTALYGPEHGIRADRPAGEHVDSYIDDKTGLPVHSLYGATWTPTEEMLEDVDVLLFDIQDIDSNVYTYIYTMGFAMEGAAEHDKELIVLDRPNPNGGTRVEGPVRKEETVSFMGQFLVPIRHGMTTGELATMWNEEYSLGTDLKVAEMDNWERDMLFEDTELPWIMPSPNIPTEDTAHLYAGTELLDDTNLSEGLGTTRPYELVGAPWIDAEELAIDMNNLELSGVKFRAAHFTPTSGQYGGELVAGVQVHITNPLEINQVELGLSLISEMRDQNPEKFEMDDNYAGLIGDPVAADMLRDGEPVEDIIASWEDELDTWNKNVRNEYLLYSHSNEDVDTEEDKKGASHIKGLISKLPKASELTLRDKEAIEDVRAAYEDLSKEAKELVTTLYNLEARENRIVELEDKKGASHIKGLIYKLPKASELTLGNKEAVEDVRAAYEDLSKEAKALVTTISQLEAREAKLEELDEQEELASIKFKGLKVDEEITEETVKVAARDQLEIDEKYEIDAEFVEEGKGESFQEVWKVTISSKEYSNLTRTHYRVGIKLLAVQK